MCHIKAACCLKRPRLYTVCTPVVLAIINII